MAQPTRPTASSANALGARDQHRFAYLGPEGTFTEQALRTLPAAEGARLLAVSSADEALVCLGEGAADAAMLPVHNTVGGLVPATVHALVGTPALEILREVSLTIDFALLTRPGLSFQEIRSVTGHPHARAQAAAWLGESLPSARWVPAPSNAAGAAWVRAGQCDATLAGCFTAARYGLEIAAEHIQDHPGALTRFLLVAFPGIWRSAPPSDSSRTSMVSRMAGRAPQVGARLSQLAQHECLGGATLGVVQSRNDRNDIFIDCPGNLDDPATVRAVDILRSNIPGLRILSSYPADPPTVPGHRQDIPEAPSPERIKWSGFMDAELTNDLHLGGEVSGLRARIDALDDSIIAALGRRLEASSEIQRVRMDSGGSRTDEGREHTVRNRYAAALGSQGSTIADSLLRLCRGPDS